jgi:hypothetical protein
MTEPSIHPVLDDDPEPRELWFFDPEEYPQKVFDRKGILPEIMKEGEEQLRLIGLLKRLSVLTESPNPPLYETMGEEAWLRREPDAFLNEHTDAFGINSVETLREWFERATEENVEDYFDYMEIIPATAQQITEDRNRIRIHNTGSQISAENNQNNPEMGDADLIGAIDAINPGFNFNKRKFKYKCIVNKNGGKMYYKRVSNKWKRITNKEGMKCEKGKRLY